MYRNTHTLVKVNVSLVPQAMDPAHLWYYMLEMGFYVSLLLSVSVDVKRKVSVLGSHITHTHTDTILHVTLFFID